MTIETQDDVVALQRIGRIVSLVLQRMLDAGWTTTDVVTLSQLVSFLAFQIRVVAGLRVLAAARA